MTSSTGPEGAAAGWERAADRPLADPSADRLGYAPFARALATGISEIKNPDGVVVAVNGAWGLGKTTVLNFVEHYLREIESNGFVFLRFNPWWFSGRVDLALAFLSELRSAVSRMPAVAGEIKKHLLTLSQIAGSIPYASEWGKAAERLLSRQSDVASVKAKIADALASQGKRIVIMVDDIDRLTRDEVSELFGVIKALADFPNTVYVLAFDDERVARQLGGHFGESGRDYLEKVVQLPFHLPPPDRAGIRELFIGQLNEILARSSMRTSSIRRSGRAPSRSVSTAYSRRRVT